VPRFDLEYIDNENQKRTVQKLKIGVLGAGHLGKIHIQCILAQPEHFEFVGFFDLDDKNAAIAMQKFDCQRFTSIDELIQQCDIIDIVTPTVTHFELAQQVITAGKHVFIEKPITQTVAEAKVLLALAETHNVKIQVGHVERFNPAFLALSETPLKPMFIEAHRLAEFNPRGTDVSVVLDLMIHDLDIVLHAVQSPIKQVHASGVSIVSTTPDIANARIEFENGCVANLTASRLSFKQMRKIRLFQPDAYISLDFLEKTAQIIRLYEKDASNVPDLDTLIELETQNGTKLIHFQQPESAPVNAIQMELASFKTSIVENTRPVVNGEDGFRALEAAHKVLEAMAASTVVV
jgi:predicted dehydrogenase